MSVVLNDLLIFSCLTALVTGIVIAAAILIIWRWKRVFELSAPSLAVRSLGHSPGPRGGRGRPARQGYRQRCFAGPERQALRGHSRRNRGSRQQI